MHASRSVNYDHNGLEVIDTDECWTLLSAAPIGRVAFVDAGEPQILPVTFLVVDRHLAFRSVPGAKLSAAQSRRPVGFEVDAWNADRAEGWSVLVEGFVEVVYDVDEISDLESRGLTSWTPGTVEMVWVRVVPTTITGRRIRRIA